MTPADQEPTMPTTDERAAFEAWATANGVDLTLWMGHAPEAGFASGRTADYYTGWLARASLAPSPAAGEAPDLEHVANEWADMATNGLQWIRNIAEGISTPADALANMERCLRHCYEVRDAQKAACSIAAPPAPSQPAPATDATQALQTARDIIADEREALIAVSRVRGNRVGDAVAHGLVYVHEDGVWLESHAADPLKNYDRALEMIDAALSQPAPAQPVNAQMLEALRKCKTCALATEVRDLVNAAITAAEASQPAPAQPVSSRAIALALIRPECDRLREWAAVGPVQRAAVEAFADAITAAQPAPAQAVPTERGWQPRALMAEQVLREIVEHVSQSGDHTPESFRRGMVSLMEPAHKILRAAAAAPVAQAERAGWREVMQRLIAGIDHLSEIARQWEPDYSSGQDRRGWVLATDARDEAARLLAAPTPDQTKG